MLTWVVTIVSPRSGNVTYCLYLPRYRFSVGLVLSVKMTEYDQFENGKFEIMLQTILRPPFNAFYNHVLLVIAT